MNKPSNEEKSTPSRAATTPALPPEPPPLPDDGGAEFLRMTLGYHGDVWPRAPNDPPLEPGEEQRSDRLLKEPIEVELADGDVDTSGLDVAVRHGEVELTGVVTSARDLRVASDIASHLLGVEKLKNDLHVEQREG